MLFILTNIVTNRNMNKVRKSMSRFLLFWVSYLSFFARFSGSHLESCWPKSMVGQPDRHASVWVTHIFREKYRAFRIRRQNSGWVRWCRTMARESQHIALWPKWRFKHLDIITLPQLWAHFLYFILDMHRITQEEVTYSRLIATWLDFRHLTVCMMCQNHRLRQY